MNYNKTLFAGRLARDCTLRYLPSQSAVCDFSVCSNRTWKDKSGEKKEEACFLDCVAFGVQAENINKFFSKGKSIFLEGRLRLESWEAKEGGKRSKIVLLVESWSFVDSQGAKPSERVPGSKPDSAQDEYTPFGEKDIPFAHNLPSRWI